MINHKRCSFKSFALGSLILTAALLGCASEDINGERVNLVAKISKSSGSDSIKLSRQINSYDWDGFGVFKSGENINFEFSQRPVLYKRIKGTHGQIIGSPIIIDQTLLFLTDLGVVVSIDLKSYKENWSVSVIPRSDNNEIVIGGGLAAADGRIFVTTSFGELISITIPNGVVDWRFRFPSPFIVAPTIFDQQLFTMSADGVVRAHSLAGISKWQQKNVRSQHIPYQHGRPVGNSKRLFVPYPGGKLVALDSKSGLELWSYNYNSPRIGHAKSSLGKFIGTPTIVDEKIYLGSYSGQFSAVNVDGSLEWDAAIGARGSAVVIANSIFFISDLDALVHLNRTDGTEVWSKAVSDKKETVVFYGPIFAGDRLWVTGESRKLIAIDAQTGSIEIDIKLDLIPGGNPLYSDGKLIIYSNKGEFLFFE